MTRSIFRRLQVATLLVVLYVLLLPGYSNAFEATAAGIKSATSILHFTNIKEIMSVTSPFPNMINGDPAKMPTNKVTYDGNLPPGCPIPVKIIGKDKDGKVVSYIGTLTPTTFDATVLTNAAGIKGDTTKLDALITELGKTHDVQIVSRRDTPPPAGNQEIAIVLADKTTKSNHLSKQDTEDAIQNAITRKPELQSITPITGNCGSSCSGTCEAVLQLEGGSSGTVVPVKSPTDVVHANLPTKWESKCTRNPMGVCTASPKTCLNGGTCSANRENAPNICTCTPQTNLYGPRCQLLTRSYEGTSSDKYVTSHKLINDGGIQSRTFSFSFEHAGKCQLGSGLCTILVVQAFGKQLLKVEEGVANKQLYNTATLPVDEPAEEMTIYSDRMVQNNRWIEVTVHVTVQGTNLKATTVFCTKEANPICAEKSVEKAGVVEKTRKADLTLGGHVHGCFRNLRFNGGLVDLKLASSAAGTNEGCTLQSQSCSSTCGDGDANSNCYGMLGSAVSSPCSCKCASSKRMPAERITQPMRCSAQCTTESPIISVTGSGALNWKGTNSASIPLNPQGPLTISFLLRTKQAVTSELLKIQGSGTTITIKVEDNYLAACIAGNCFAFSSVPVNDGKWHEIFAMVAKTQLTVRVGDYARVYIIASQQPISEATVSMQLVNGCTRDVRLSDIYMPTSNADKTEEKDSSDSIKLDVSGSVTAGSSCAV